MGNATAIQIGGNLYTLTRADLLAFMAEATRNVPFDGPWDDMLADLPAALRSLLQGKDGVDADPCRDCTPDNCEWFGVCPHSHKPA